MTSEEGMLLCPVCLDVPGNAKRVYKSARMCPVDGRAVSTDSSRRRRLRGILFKAGANSDEAFMEAEAVNLETTLFRSLRPGSR